MKAAITKPSYIDGMSNEEYHLPANGVSCSNIKDFIADPASVVWGRNAPQDKDKMPAIDFGTDFHSYFLEPERFKEEYQVLPTFNRRKADEKQAELDLIEKWKAEGITPVTAEDMQKLEHMRQSAIAHPSVKAMMELPDGVAERSFFWQDKDTGIDCKCRSDWFAGELKDKPAFMPSDADTLIMDVKTIANIGRIQNQIEELKYYVQDAFYSQGVAQVTGGNVCFVFVFVSTSLSIGRYPVRVVTLSQPAKHDGYNEIKEALPQYAEFMKGNGQGAVELDRPMWAARDDENLL